MVTSHGNSVEPPGRARAELLHNATVRQRIRVIPLYHGYLLEEGSGSSKPLAEVVSQERQSSAAQPVRLSILDAVGV